MDQPEFVRSPPVTLTEYEKPRWKGIVGLDAGASSQPSDTKSDPRVVFYFFVVLKDVAQSSVNYIQVLVCLFCNGDPPYRLKCREHDC